MRGGRVCGFTALPCRRPHPWDSSQYYVSRAYCTCSINILFWIGPKQSEPYQYFTMYCNNKNYWRHPWRYLQYEDSLSCMMSHLLIWSTPGSNSLCSGVCCSFTSMQYLLCSMSTWPYNVLPLWICKWSAGLLCPFALSLCHRTTLLCS